MQLVLVQLKIGLRGGRRRLEASMMAGRRERVSKEAEVLNE